MTKTKPDETSKGPTPTTLGVRPEAELESRIATALMQAFPNIGRDQLVEQRRFTVQLGRATHTFDSTALWEKAGRADILLFLGERPLAVLEIKREDLELGTDDYAQAQSYANQLTPRPPLVIVSNGEETRVYDANTGAEWAGGDDAQAGVRQLLANAAKVAAADMRWAIEALMGRETEVWTLAVRDCTARLIAELTNPPGERGLPFAQTFLFSRVATQRATKLLKEGPAVAVVEGPPVSGKSSLLRDLAVRTETSEDLAVLMLRGSGPGLYRAVANLFAAELDWTLSPDDARHWLRRMSQAGAGPTLVLAIDDVAPGSDMAKDLEELMSLRPGPRLKILLTTDRAEALTRTPNGRTLSGLGAQADSVSLESMCLEEFRAAAQALAKQKIRFSKGAECAQDFRAPWVLRAIYDNIARDPRFADPTTGALLPPALGLALIDETRDAYTDQPGLLRGYRVLARDALADDGALSAELALRASHSFVIRRDALSPEGREEVANLVAAGWVRTLRLGRDDVVAPTVPAAFLVEMAEAAAEELDRRAKIDCREAGVWLGRRLDAISLGDLIGAEAVRCVGKAQGEFSADIIWGLLSVTPEEQVMDDALIAFEGADGRLVHIKVKDSQAWLSDASGRAKGEPVDLEPEPARSYSDTTAWMILAQFARLPIAAVGNDNDRMDAAILLEIGQCPFPLVRAAPEGVGLLEHDFDDLGRVICSDTGAIEGVTQAMADLLSRSWEGADSFIDAVLESGSLPLLHRLMIALQLVRERKIPDRSGWADALLCDRVVHAVAERHR